MNCPYCENALPAGETKCPSCGAPVPASALQQQQQPFQQPHIYVQVPQLQAQQQQQTPVNNGGAGGVRKSPSTAGCLSFLICGVGQMYNGQVAKGVVLLIAALVVGSFTFGVGGLIILIISIVDAIKIAEKINAGKTVGQWEFF